jgi:hypothetical protein
VVRLVLVGALCAALAGCEGEPPPVVPDPPERPACDPTAPLPQTTRLPRLTHQQYDATIRDLLGLDLGASAEFLRDPDFAGFDNDAEALKVTDRLARDYRRAAEALAAIAADSPVVLARIVPCDRVVDPDGCARAFVEHFVGHAYRRPATEEEVLRYVALFERGALVGDGPDPFAEGVQLVVEAALQSPSFLYRVERSEAVAADGTIALDGWEVATRLSYMLWGTMPDDALFAAAAAGELGAPAAIREQALRMLEDPRAEDVVADFHAQWLQLDGVQDLSRDPALLPGFGRDTVAAMLLETDLFVRHVVFDLDGGLRELLTLSVGFPNDQLAPIYGLVGTGAAIPAPTPLDPAERAGLLTQPSFLATHAGWSETSPIQRGVFVHRQILCTDLPDPPPNLNRDPSTYQGEARTTRERIAGFTSPPQCAVCHEVINPPGFAFEGFDAIGRRRLEDSGVPVDTTGELDLEAGVLPFDDAVDLVHILAEADEVRRCYARNWFRYARARSPGRGDSCDMERLAETLEADGSSVKDLLVEITQTRGFLSRAPVTEEESP